MRASTGEEHDLITGDVKSPMWDLMMLSTSRMSLIHGDRTVLVASIKAPICSKTLFEGALLAHQASSLANSCGMLKMLALIHERRICAA